MKILSHPGLGDHLIINGLVRAIAATGAVSLAVKEPYLEAVRFLYRDLMRVDLTGIPAGHDPYQFQEGWSAGDGDAIRLGQFSGDWHGLLAHAEWDEVFYQQAGVPIEVRWSGSHVERDQERERRLCALLGVPMGGYQVLHEDRGRGFTVDRSLLHPYLPVVEIDQALTGHLSGNPFDFLGLLAGARAFHCFPSSFFLLVDHFLGDAPLECHLHDYVRPVPMGRLGKAWHVIRGAAHG